MVDVFAETNISMTSAIRVRPITEGDSGEGWEVGADEQEKMEHHSYMT